MSLPFDATVKDLVVTHPHDFDQMFAQERTGPVDVLNVDLSTVSASTDVVIGYGDPLDSITDWNFQASRDPELISRALVYNALLHHRHHVLVESVIVLMRSKGNDTSLDGRYMYQSPARGGGKVEFRYRLIRLWEIPVSRLLRGGPGTLPLAVLGKLEHSGRRGLESIVNRVAQRIDEETSGEEERKLLTAAYTLIGLRTNREDATRLFKRIPQMKESTTYQAILDEGRDEGRDEGLRQGELRASRNLILRLGKVKFGKCGKRVENRVNKIDDLEQLAVLFEQMLSAKSWDELLAD